MLFSAFSKVINATHQKGNTIVLALSGGVDSRVMLELLGAYKQKNPNNRYCAVHIHHGLSPNAEEWVSKCEMWCAEVGIPLAVEQVRLNLGSQVSIEQEARDKRYQALSKHINHGDTLLTGQHLSDQTETFLLALKRGSGPKGLSSMPEQTSFGLGKIVRPLLRISRDEIVRYAKKSNLDWVEDESNQDDKFDRNFLRNNITPLLNERWPHIESAISRSADLCAQQELLLEELLADKLQGMVSEDQSISVSALSAQSELARNHLLRLWLAQNGWLMPSQKQLGKIWTEVALSKADANPKLNYTSGEIRRYKDRLYMVESHADVSQWKKKIKIDEQIELPDSLGSLELKRSDSDNCLRLPRENEELWVTFNPEGLSAHPIDRGHSRSLKKLFQEYGVPSWLRRRIPILMVDDRVAAVVGLFADKAFSGQDCELVWNKMNQGVKTPDQNK
ncbi:tRNA lysidine(34) synthetase TilS [Vibrio sp. HN007]